MIMNDKERRKCSRCQQYLTSRSFQNKHGECICGFCMLELRDITRCQMIDTGLIQVSNTQYVSRDAIQELEFMEGKDCVYGVKVLYVKNDRPVEYHNRSLIFENICILLRREELIADGNE